MVARTTTTTTQLDFRRLRRSFHSRPKKTKRKHGARGDRSADIGETSREKEKKREEKGRKRDRRCNKAVARRRL